MSEIYFPGKIYLSITGIKNADWQSKLEEINRLGIKETAVFLECFKKPQRENLYHMLLKSSIKRVPFVHLRDDNTKDEIKFFSENFGTGHFNIHEHSFNSLNQWKGYWDKLYLEMDYNNEIAKNVKVKKIGGFCVDLSHFMAALGRGSKEAYYIFLRKNKIKFACNHLNGYSPEKNCDLHTIKSLKDFDYLTDLPKWVFGEIIALEVFNSIEDQIKFKSYIEKCLYQSA